MPADTDTPAQPVETDRMRLIDAELRQRGEKGLRAFLTEGWDGGKAVVDGKTISFDRLAEQLRKALSGSPYEGIPRETMIGYMRRYGILPAKRPTGMARVRRNRTT